MSEIPEFRERGIVAVHLLQGVIYEEQEEIWSLLLSNESDLTDYFCEIGLSLVIDRTEGMAYLRQFSDATPAVHVLPQDAAALFQGDPDILAVLRQPGLHPAP